MVAYLCVCLYIHYSTPCLLGDLPVTKRKVETKVTGTPKERMRDVLQSRNPRPHLGAYPLVT